MFAVLFLLACVSSVFATPITYTQSLTPFQLSHFDKNANSSNGLPLKVIWLFARFKSAVDNSQYAYFRAFDAPFDLSFFSMAWELTDICTSGTYLPGPYLGTTSWSSNSDQITIFGTGNDLFKMTSDGTITVKDGNGLVDLTSTAGGCEFEFQSVYGTNTSIDVVYRSRMGNVVGTFFGKPVVGFLGIDAYFGNIDWLLAPIFQEYERDMVVFYDYLANGKQRYGYSILGNSPFIGGFVARTDQECVHGDLISEPVLAIDDQDCGTETVPIRLITDEKTGHFREYQAHQHIVTWQLPYGVILKQMACSHHISGPPALLSLAWYEQFRH